MSFLCYSLVPRRHQYPPLFSGCHRSCETTPEKLQSYNPKWYIPRSPCPLTWYFSVYSCICFFTHSLNTYFNACSRSRNYYRWSRCWKEKRQFWPQGIHQLGWKEINMQIKRWDSITAITELSTNWSESFEPWEISGIPTVSTNTAFKYP